MEVLDSITDPILPKQRHGCVTAWLIIIIIANSFSALIYFFSSDLVMQSLEQQVPYEVLILLGVSGIANVIFAILLFKWQKVAFWGFVATCIAVFAINISIGVAIGQSLLGLSAIAIFYGVLQIKRNNVSAWDNLE